VRLLTAARALAVQRREIRASNDVAPPVRLAQALVPEKGIMEAAKTCAASGV
jgi:hypothetical protein